MFRYPVRHHVGETNVPSENDESDAIVSFSGKLRVSDLFARDHPASLEGPREAWGLAKTVIDHGCYFFEKLDSCRSALGLRDLVVRALFRRILITGEAIRSLLVRGLEEPATATSRTLLELERDLRLVMADASDARARRLALFSAVKGRRNFDKAAANPDARDFLQGDAHFFRWFRDKSRSFRDWIDSEAFRDVADELSRANHWHGFAQQKEAFEKAGMARQFHVGYAGSSLFAHGGNVEHDFADADASGIRLKPLAQRDPVHTLNQLGQLTLSLIEIYRLIWKDRGKPEYQESFVAEAGGQPFELHALDVLRAQAINILPDPQRSNFS